MPDHQFPPTPPRDISELLTARIQKLKEAKEAARELQQQQRAQLPEAAEGCLATGGPSPSTAGTSSSPPQVSDEPLAGRLVSTADAFVAVKVHPADQGLLQNGAKGKTNGTPTPVDETARQGVDGKGVTKKTAIKDGSGLSGEKPASAEAIDTDGGVIADGALAELDSATRSTAAESREASREPRLEKDCGTEDAEEARCRAEAAEAAEAAALSRVLTLPTGTGDDEDREL